MSTEAGKRLLLSMIATTEAWNRGFRGPEAVATIEAEARQQGFDAAWAESSVGVEGEIAEAVAARDAEIATVTRQRDLLANAVVHVIGRPGRPGECPICRGAEPCEADDPAIQLAAGMFAGASEAELAAIVEHP